MALGVSGCLDRQLKPLNPCLVSGVSRQVSVNNVDKVDLLFMVDNSDSMANKQASLKAQFPKLIHVLTSGERFAGDPSPFPPAKDLHVGVVTSDMGIPGVEFGTCHADGGDDGKLQHTPHGSGCDETYPLFLSYSAAAGTDPVKFANDFQCVASVGTGGCGFEEQLESPFKALWPSIYTDAKGNVVNPNPYHFIATTTLGLVGRGDIPEAQGGNLGFLRSDVNTGLSLIAIVVLTDEDDCSVSSTEHLKPANQLSEGSPYKNQDINLRCFYNPQFSYDVLDRYLKGFRMLRPGNENLVVFAAITGVPTDLVNADAQKGTDFTNQGARDAYYDGILADPRMQEQIDPSTHPGTGTGNLMPACAFTDLSGQTAFAAPARRISSLVKGFGESGVLQSICQNDFGPAMDAIVDVIAKQLGAVCLPRPLVRKADGTVACNVVWELPAPGKAPSTTPTTCSLPYLGPVDEGRAAMNSRGGNNCKVTQLPVTDASEGASVPQGDGWYYDTFTTELKQSCKANEPQRVAFTPTAKPPTGVTVKLECLTETQHYAETRTDEVESVAPPEIGSSCEKSANGTGVSGDAACVVTFDDGKTDKTMFCHPDLNVCVRQCSSDPDCPPAWVCDTRPETLEKTAGKGAYCVNPTCGTDG
jgi:hypothetical protein